jgi:CBS domain containing-hemolysin-like protein
VSLPENDDYDTIAGLVLRELGRIPLAGDLVEIALPIVNADDEEEEQPDRVAVLRVEQMDGLRIDRIHLRVDERPGEVVR